MTWFTYFAFGLVSFAAFFGFVFTTTLVVKSWGEPWFKQMVNGFVLNYLLVILNTSLAVFWYNRLF